MLTHFGETGNMGIAIRDNASFGLNQFHDFNRRRLTHIIYVFLIGNTQYQDATAFKSLASFIQPIH
ncbi:hypothetical protein CR64_37960 [Pseudomonas aeruginosa]|nr:hypothetical protein CR64_37960 [Pseudomonas aeruginosa]